MPTIKLQKWLVLVNVKQTSDFMTGERIKRLEEENIDIVIFRQQL